jgi:hypothetical protein
LPSFSSRALRTRFVARMHQRSRAFRLRDRPHLLALREPVGGRGRRKPTQRACTSSGAPRTPTARRRSTSATAGRPQLVQPGLGQERFDPGTEAALLVADEPKDDTGLEPSPSSGFSSSLSSAGRRESRGRGGLCAKTTSEDRRRRRSLPRSLDRRCPAASRSHSPACVCAVGRFFSPCSSGGGPCQADEDAQRTHEREVLVAVEPTCSWGRRQERGERLVAVRARARTGNPEFRAVKMCDAVRCLLRT